jgi:hypothetical protein
MEHASATGADDPYHYYRSMKRSWPLLDTEIGTPDVDGREAVVSLELTRSIPILNHSLPKRRSAIDHWLWADGRWWHVETIEGPVSAGSSANDDKEQPQAAEVAGEGSGALPEATADADPGSR